MDISIEDAAGSRGARWVCPNDRHLALRAKLRTGWSVKTESLESRWNTYPSSNSYSNQCQQSFVLTEEERRRIIQVIQRAEALDLTEQERIGRLVERLENMKRNVCVVTSTRSNERRSCGSRCSSGARCVCACALCGEKFGAVLGASPNLCKDCRKYICQKCGIEATPVLNAPLGTDIGSSPRTMSVSMSALDRTAVQRIVQRTGNAQKQFLCRICAETREMWKKSGAWFFKGMPKYVLPEKKERGWSRTSHRTSAWTVSDTSKSLESEPQDSSSDDDATRRLAIARSSSTSAANVQGNRESNASKTTFSGSSKIYRGRSNDLSPTGQREDSVQLISERLGKSTLSIPSQCGRLSPSNSVTTFRSKSGGRSPIEPGLEQRVSFEEKADEKMNSAEDEVDNDARRESSVDRSKSSQVQSVRKDSTIPTVIMTTPTMERVQDLSRTFEKSMDLERTQGLSGQETQGSAKRTNSQTDLTPLQAIDYTQAPAIGMGPDYGTLEISLRYDPAAQCLQCKVERARGLRPMDIHGLADPFCKLNIIPTGMGASMNRLRTRTVHKTCDPEFNETLNFYGTTESDMTSGKALHVLILQDDPAGQDFLGEAKFPLYELHPYQTRHYNVPLQDHYLVDREEEIWGISTNMRGRIQVTLTYCTRRRALLVTVHQATNLLPMDSNGFSDPFVKLWLIEGMTENHRQRTHENPIIRGTARKLAGKKTSTNRTVHSTSVKRKTLNPEWNEEFAFGIRLTDLTKHTLYLSLWDKDFGKNNDYLGGLALGCNSKGARLRHWIDAIKFPDHHHRSWHDLTDTIIPLE